MTKKLKRGENSVIKGTHTREAVRKFVLKAGVVGVSSPVVAKAAGVCLSIAQGHLSTLLDTGEIGRSYPAGTNTRYGPPEIWDAWAERREKLAGRREKRRLLREREAAKAMEDSPADYPQRTFVAAGAVPPVQTRAPASIWAYAGACGD
jgi:hypothetical protein